MDVGARHCALPGCDEALRTVSGRPERRYCTAAHRMAARQARRAATRGCAAVVTLDRRRELRVRDLPEPAAATRATPQERARSTMDRLRAQARRTVEEARSAEVRPRPGHGRDDGMEIR